MSGMEQAPDGSRTGQQEAASSRPEQQEAASSRTEQQEADGSRVEWQGAGGSLAERQGALVAALTAGGPVPRGFDARRVEVARVALVNKRRGEVARHWPDLAASLGPRWRDVWAAWAATRPTRGSLRDGWDLARYLEDAGELPRQAAAELSTREATLRYNGVDDPRPRRLPALHVTAGTVVLQLAGRPHILRRS